MLDIEYDCLMKFIESVLHGKTGISEESFIRLRQLADVMHQCPDHAERSHLIEGILDMVDAIDGEFYLPDDED